MQLFLRDDNTLSSAVCTCCCSCHAACHFSDECKLVVEERKQRGGEVQQTNRSLGLQTMAPMSMREAYSVLGIDPSTMVSSEMLRSCYRAKVLAAHPDKGGSNDDFSRCHEAYKVLQAALCGGSTPATPPTTPCGVDPRSDILSKAFAGEDVEAELVARGVYRPPAGFGCPPFTARWEDEAAARVPRTYQYASSSDNEE